jgi:hypothetical protein
MHAQLDRMRGKVPQAAEDRAARRQREGVLAAARAPTAVPLADLLAHLTSALPPGDGRYADGGVYRRAVVATAAAALQQLAAHGPRPDGDVRPLVAALAGALADAATADALAVGARHPLAVVLPLWAAYRYGPSPAPAASAALPETGADPDGDRDVADMI